MKGLSFLLFTLFYFTVCQAQLELKPSIGLNASRFNTDPQDSLGQISGRVGWQFGGSLLFGKKWYFEPGFFMLSQGHELQAVNLNSQNVKFSNDIKSMYIPMVFGYHLIGNEEGLFGMRVFAGGSIQIITDIDSQIPELRKEDFKIPIWGMNAGVGLNVWLIFFDLSYQWDFTNTYVLDTENTKNHIFKANLGARIKF